MKIILGFDIGTSGVRACIVERLTTDDPNILNSDHNKIEQIIAVKHTPVSLPTATSDNSILASPDVWINALNSTLKALSQVYDLRKITHIIGDATSSTVLLTDKHGARTTEALMYNDNSATSEAELISQMLSRLSISFTAASGSSSSLAKSLFLKNRFHPKNTDNNIICHQLDFVNQYLCNPQFALGITDENNALKLGFNSVDFCWPEWVKALTDSHHLVLPKVVKPGSILGIIDPSLAKKFGFSTQAKVCAGTTDSIAGFLASGAHNTGDTVCSLGSTIAIKTIGNKPVFDAQKGLYSHRLNNLWLIGGASNAGGAVFLKYYSKQNLHTLCRSIDISTLPKYLKRKLSYYPLSEPGERFPIADNGLKPKLPAVPSSSLDFNNPKSLKEHQEFLLGLSLGLAQVEALALSKLQQCGDTPIQYVYSVGGGNLNPVWQWFRKQLINAEMSIVTETEAAFGVTRLVE